MSSHDTRANFTVNDRSLKYFFNVFCRFTQTFSYFSLFSVTFSRVDTCAAESSGAQQNKNYVTIISGCDGHRTITTIRKRQLQQRSRRSHYYDDFLITVAIAATITTNSSSIIIIIIQCC